MAVREPNGALCTWRKRLLVPLWTLQLLYQLFLFAIGMWNYVGGSFVVARVILLLLEILTLVLILHEILLFARLTALGNAESNAAHSPLFILTPVNFFVFQLFKTCIWIVIFAAGIWLAFGSNIRDELKNGFLTLIPFNNSETRPFDLSAPYLGVILHGIAFALFLPTLIYATCVFVKHRRDHRRGRPAKVKSWVRDVESPSGDPKPCYSPELSEFPFSPSSFDSRNATFGTLSIRQEMACHPAFAPPELPSSSVTTSPIVGGWRSRLWRRPLQPQQLPENAIYELSAVKTPASSKRSTRGFGRLNILRHQRKESKTSTSCDWIDLDSGTSGKSSNGSVYSEEALQSPETTYSPSTELVSPVSGNLTRVGTFQPFHAISPISEGRAF